MATYTECRCLSDELHNILKRAIDNLKSIELGDTIHKEREREAKLKEPLEALAMLSSRMSPELVEEMKKKIYAEVPMSEEERLFQDLDKYLESCQCPDDVHIDWHKFPYGQASSQKTPFRKKASTLPIEEAESISSEIRSFGSKMKDAIENPVTFTAILNHPSIGGDQTKVSWGKTRDVLEDLGYISKDEVNRITELNKKFMQAGGADLIFNQQNDFLRLRGEKEMPRKPFRESR